jgi:hypothetical protein
VLVAVTATARAEVVVEPEGQSACTIPKKCSARGVECDSRDRPCQDSAIASELEIVCERPRGEGLAFVYCPPGGTSRDSRVVWVLLAVAIGVAVGGGAVAWRVLRS